jgi:hypothetical protein
LSRFVRAWKAKGLAVSTTSGYKGRKAGTTHKSPHSEPACFGCVNGRSDFRNFPFSKFRISAAHAGGCDFRPSWMRKRKWRPNFLALGQGPGGASPVTSRVGEGPARQFRPMFGENSALGDAKSPSEARSNAMCTQRCTRLPIIEPKSLRLYGRQLLEGESLRALRSPTRQRSPAV